MYFPTNIYINLIMRKRVYFYVFGSLLLFALIVCALHQFDSFFLTRLSDFPRPNRRQSSTEMLDSDRDKNDYGAATDFQKRLFNIRYQCAVHRENLTGPLPRLYVAKRNKLRYCKVPKTGSTFWMEVFILLNKMADTNHTFGKNRGDIHMLMDAKNKKANLSEISVNDSIIVVTRDPFSRIYSAFVDKIYLPSLWQTHPSISKDKTNISSKNNTFAVFLDYIIRMHSSGKSLNEHWVPITEHCGICKIPYNFILKQETFQRDVEYVLNHIDIEKSTREIVFSFLREKHVENTLSEVLEEMIGNGRSAEKKGLLFMDFAERLWTAFQIQGYISDNVFFPKEKFESLNYSSVQVPALKQLYVNGVNEYKLSSAEKHSQRERHLCNAYKTIPEDTLDKIIQIYQRDFLFLGYSSFPPHLRSTNLFKEHKGGIVLRR